jgi:Tfp pilus assembly protein PilF
MPIVIDENELRRLRANLPSEGVKRIPGPQLTQMAAQALELKDARRAVDLAQAALLIDPEDSQALRVIGQATLRLGDHASAKRAFERAIIEDPHDWQSACDLARLHAAAGETDEARSLLALLTSDADVPSEALAALAKDLGRAS